jgi:Acyl-coenzyme A:6-aminopenicillanic acid acyl-transferase
MARRDGPHLTSPTAVGEVSLDPPPNPQSAIRNPQSPSPRSQTREGFVQIKVAGSPYEMGLQHGELLRDEIRSLLDAVYHHVLYGQPGIVGWGLRRGTRTVPRLMEPYIPRRYRREMAGVAHAADVSYRDVLLLNCFDDVLANLRILAAMFGRLGCSAFAANASPEALGELVSGRNLDYYVNSAVGDDVWAATNYMKQHVVVVEHAPHDAARFASVVWPGFVGVATAMSEAGMVASALVVATIRNRPLATPAPFLYRRIVEETSRVDDAVGMLQRARRTQGHNVLLASAEDQSAAVVEYTPWRFAVRRPKAGWLATTNHFVDPEMTRRYARFELLSSTDRLARLCDLCGGDGIAGGDLTAAGQLLLDTEIRSPDANEYCTIFNPCTIYSTLFAPMRNRMWVRVADRPDRTFEPVDIGA